MQAVIGGIAAQEAMKVGYDCRRKDVQIFF
jgi:hypothetical protein